MLTSFETSQIGIGQSASSPRAGAVGAPKTTLSSQALPTTNVQTT